MPVNDGDTFSDYMGALKMKTPARLEMLASLVLLFTAMGVWAETHEVQLLSGPFRFEPNDLTIQAGDSVRWINNNSFHSVDADDGSR